MKSKRRKSKRRKFRRSPFKMVEPLSISIVAQIESGRVRAMVAQVGPIVVNDGKSSEDAS